MSATIVSTTARTRLRKMVLNCFIVYLIIYGLSVKGDDYLVFTPILPEDIHDMPHEADVDRHEGNAEP
jgi:hypothetical protein